MTKPCSIASPNASANAPASVPANADPRRVTGAYLQPLLDTAAARGVGPEALARAAGLAPDALVPLPETLGAADYIRLLDAGAQLTGDPCFGLHVGERVRPGTYSVYGLVLLACRDVGQALEQTMRYEALAHELGRSRLTLEGALACYEWVSHYPRASRHLVESVFAGIQTFGRWLAGGQLAAAQITFAHGAGPDDAEYLRVFGTRPQFGQRANAARFDAALLALPVPHADVGLYPVLREHAERQLAQRTGSGQAAGIVAQVWTAIEQGLARDGARLAAVAQALGMSPRTLQRKLADAGTSFGQVLDGARHALALAYLRQPGLAMSDIAFLLGYQEQSAFNHAFKEWTGMNPGAWRLREAGQDGERGG